MIRAPGPVRRHEEQGARNDGLGFLDGARVSGAARLGGAVLPGGDRPGRPALPRGSEVPGPPHEGDRGPAQAAGEGQGPVGLFLGEELGGPGFGSSAGASERGPRPIRSAPVSSAPGSRQRQHGDPRRVRDPRTEGTGGSVRCGPAAVVSVFDDRAAGGLGPVAVPDQPRFATATSGSSTASSGSPASAGRRLHLGHVQNGIFIVEQGTPGIDWLYGTGAHVYVGTTTSGCRSTTCSGRRAAGGCWPSEARWWSHPPTRCGRSRPARRPST